MDTSTKAGLISAVAAALDNDDGTELLFGNSIVAMAATVYDRSGMEDRRWAIPN